MRMWSTLPLVLAFGLLSTSQANEVTSLAARVGLTTKALTIAQLKNSASSIMSKLAGAQELRASLTQQELAARQADELLAIAANRSAPADDESQEALTYAEAVQQFDAAHALVGQTLEALRAVALDGVPAENVLVLDRLRVVLRYRVPTEFGVQLHSESEWDQLEAAVHSEKAALRYGRAVDPADAALLSAIRSDVAVIQATQLLATDLPSVEQAMEDAPIAE